MSDVLVSFESIALAAQHCDWESVLQAVSFAQKRYTKAAVALKEQCCALDLFLSTSATVLKSQIDESSEDAWRECSEMRMNEHKRLLEVKRSAAASKESAKHALDEAAGILICNSSHMEALSTVCEDPHHELHPVSIDLLSELVQLDGGHDAASHRQLFFAALVACLRKRGEPTGNDSVQEWKLLQYFCLHSKAHQVERLWIDCYASTLLEKSLEYAFRNSVQAKPQTAESREEKCAWLCPLELWASLFMHTGLPTDFRRNTLTTHRLAMLIVLLCNKVDAIGFTYAEPSADASGASNPETGMLMFLAAFTNLIDGDVLPSTVKVKLRSNAMLMSYITKVTSGSFAIDRDRQKIAGRVLRSLDGHDDSTSSTSPQSSMQQRASMQELSTSCAHCGHLASETYKLQLCSKCMAVRYCSKYCASAAWSDHKRVCTSKLGQTECGAARNESAFSSRSGSGRRSSGGTGRSGRRSVEVRGRIDPAAVATHTSRLYCAGEAYAQKYPARLITEYSDVFADPEDESQDDRFDFGDDRMKDDDSAPWSRKSAREVGEALHRIGGSTLMEKVYMDVIPRLEARFIGGHFRYLKWCWDGVGDWQA